MKLLTRDSQTSLKSYNDCLNLIICENATSQCFFGTCSHCPNIDFFKDFLTNTFDENDINEISYKHWITRPRTSLETAIKLSIEFVEDFCNQLKLLLPHSFIAKEQAEFFRNMREILQDGEYLVVCDFAENYAFVVQDNLFQK